MQIADTREPARKLKISGSCCDKIMKKGDRQMSENDKLTSLRKLIDKLNDLDLFQKKNPALEKALDQAAEYLEIEPASESTEKVAKNRSASIKDLELR